MVRHHSQLPLEAVFLIESAEGRVATGEVFEQTVIIVVSKAVSCAVANYHWSSIETDTRWRYADQNSLEPAESVPATIIAESYRRGGKLRTLTCN